MESLARIPVAVSSRPANFPFSVQCRNTENWNAVEATVTLEAAQESAQALATKYPSLPVRIEHSKGGPQPTPLLPAYRKREGDDKPFRYALWTGKGEPAKVGARVVISTNRIGPGVVTGYAVHGGYLGLMVRADEETRPAWHKAQNPGNPAMLVFGIELTEG